MDIELLSNMVRELVLSHDEVGLPGLGSFVTEMVPASFSDRGYTINPPYRRLTFVPGKSEEDSLVRLYSQSNGVDYDQAAAIIKHFLEDTKKVLIDRKTVVFPGLGRLRATRQNNFFFITDEDLDIYPDAFGLQSISLKNHGLTAEETHVAVAELAAIVEPVVNAQQQEADFLVEPAEEPLPEVPAKAAYSEPSVIVAKPQYSSPAVSVSKPKYLEPEITVRKPEYRQPAVTVKKKAYAVPRTKVRRHISKWWWLAPLLAVAACALFIAVFLILCQVAPDFIDSLLYTPEELEIINY